VFLAVEVELDLAPAGRSMLGEIFQPAPRSRAQSAPVPSVARPPPPTAPSRFSGEMDRVWSLRSLEALLRSG
jgi:hypothetical protein